ncbi:MAG: M48 family metalloprotease [Porticoccaceae bacterium]|nr:M48 family metalloprotease [Porticoccaceae bacterium]
MARRKPTGASAYRYWLAAGWLAACLSAPSAAAAPSGKEFYEETLKRTPLFKDPLLTAYIEDLGRQVVAVSEMAGEEFIFTLLDSPELNAFATADNYVYVNRGLLNYVSNEAQLVSVIAHEVAHITRKHVDKQSSSGTATKVISTIAAVLANSEEVYSAGMAYGNSKIRSLGRRHELEADGSGAEYMAKLGYDVDQMLAMLSIMKDYEILQKQRARAKGAVRPTYHGVFASHPRNDSRLRAVVSRAKSLNLKNSRDDGAIAYRKLTQGLIWGENFLAKETPTERYSNIAWRVRFDLPEDWTQTSGVAPFAVTGSQPEGLATLSMTRLARTAQSPEEYLYNQLNITAVTDGAEITPARLKGFSGILKQRDANDNSENKAEQKSIRIAVIYYKLSAYVFRGEVLDGNDFAEQDELFVNAINTFRPISRAEIAGQKPQRVHYVKATGNTTFSGLAKAFGLSKKDVDILRVINGLYPAGEPISGAIIKVFKQ